jgi:oxygen-dependent protoporphyrinogen oxidase
MKRVVIVGAGISGLALAFRLRQAIPPVEVILLEQQDRPGGTVWTERRAGFQVEVGPNGFLDSKLSTMALCRDLGLQDRLVPASEAASRNRYLFLNGKLQPLPASFADFLKSGLLSWQGKLSLLAERFRPRRYGKEDESIDAFARRRAGREAAEVLADALVTGIHAGDPALLSVRSTFPRLAEFEREYGSVLKGFTQAARKRRAEAAARGQPYQRAGRMWSLHDGLRLLIETLAGALSPPPLFGVAVRRVERLEAGPAGCPNWLVHGPGQDRWTADAVVLTCPAYQQAAMVADLDKDLAESIGAIAYNRVAVVALGFRRVDVPGSLDGFGYITPQRSRRDLLGVQWCSSIFPDRAPPGLFLLRALCGGWHRGDVVDWDDQRLLAAVRAELQAAMGVEAVPVFHEVVRWDRAIPQYHVGHGRRVAWVEERLARYPGLFLGGNAYRGVALNDCTEQAEALAARLHRYLAGLS